MKTFDFDEWAVLAKTDPVAFAQRRMDAIEAIIASAPIERQHQLRCLQWRIDMERQRCRNPMHACIHLFNKMWDSVYGERGLLSALHMMKNIQPDAVAVGELNAGSKQPSLSSGAIASATILQFRRSKAIV